MINKLANNGKIDEDDIKEMLGSHCYEKIKLEVGD